MDKKLLRIKQLFLAYEGKVIPHVFWRWFFCLVLLVSYGGRIVVTKGFHVISYCLAILILNLFLRFLTPIKSDLEEEELDNPVLPIRDTDEFKPFLRKLGEFGLWKNMTIAIGIAFICTFFPYLDLPVFWPVLVMYFIILFVVTMRRQIAHMIKHKYIPFDIGKAKYRGSEKK
ncbi:hypothetical protein SteCoe_16337 [Stentor coeruleus]|uniref:Protein RER1 n=1 Tax=Stentor coeruleus TaxID=5963 RepID=A0A1R2C1P1_9CILI|nr:hypothetical protein SteCoe_16337 [Stentor coeruleus]